MSVGRSDDVVLRSGTSQSPSVALVTRRGFNAVLCTRSLMCQWRMGVGIKFVLGVDVQ